MLRDFVINGAKAPEAMHKAKVAMVTGMAVVKKDTTTEKLVELTSDEAVADIFFVDKERIPSGCNAAAGDMSDYSEEFVNVKVNEFVTLDRYAPGERFGTDQYDDTTINKSVAIDTRVSFKNGKAMKSTSLESIYVFKGMYDDNGHMLAVIEVSDTAKANS